VTGRLRCGIGCGDLLVITTRGSDGCEVTMRACGSCDATSWSRDGVRVELHELLGELGARRPALTAAAS
jgi:hypothetical protein